MDISKLIPLFSICFSLSCSAFLSEELVINSAVKHYPKVRASLIEVEMNRARIEEAKGAFDLSLSAKADKRFRGFYDGDSANVEIRKPLRFAGASVYSGYKISDGLFPDYEGKRDTLTGGEYRAGVEFSLLKNRSIDSQRLALMGAKIRTKQSLENVKLIKNVMKRNAKVTYWDWVTSGLIKDTFAQLLGFAQKRDKGIRRRAKNGDLARIYIDENQQYILKWRRKLQKATLDFQKMTQKLSLYYRDSAGKPIIVDEKSLPKNLVTKKSMKEIMSPVDLASLIKQNPEMINLNYEIKIAQAQLRQGRNERLPDLDISFEISRDEGEGSKTLTPTENRAFLSLKIPLQNRKGRGKVLKAKSKQGILKFKKQLLENELAVEIQNLRNQIKTYKSLVKMSYQETLLTKKLLKAEERKFTQGASDFFVVNLRETNHANAKIENLKALTRYKAAIAEHESLVFAK